MSNIELTPVHGVDAVWLDDDYVTVTFSITKGQVAELVDGGHESEVLKAVLGEAAFVAIKNAT